MMTTHIIQTERLTKQYHAKSGLLTALDMLNLSVQQGEIFGYLGPNGAGSAKIFGLDARQNSKAIRRRVGYLPGELALWDNETAQSIIRYFAGVRGGVEMRYVHELASRLDFDLTKKIRQYSTGNKRKIGLILAFMHKPELLILDEPTSGLDPLMQQVFVDLVREARAGGQTIFLSSHMLSEVQAVCDRVGIIRAGKLQTVDSVATLTHVDFRWVTLRLREPVSAALLSAIPGTQEVSVRGDTARLRLVGDIDPLLRAVGDHYVVDLRTEDPTLEEIFLTYYGDSHSANGRMTAQTRASHKEIIT